MIEIFLEVESRGLEVSRDRSDFGHILETRVAVVAMASINFQRIRMRWKLVYFDTFWRRYYFSDACEIVWMMSDGTPLGALGKSFDLFFVEV